MPKIAIIGRQNVGKSTLFNALIGRRKSIVYDQPGVTRDLVSESVSWGEGSWILTDFPGFEDAAILQDDLLSQLANQKARQQLKDYHLLLWVVSREGLTPFEEELAQELRPWKNKVWVVVNRVDDKVHEAEASEMYRLGFKEVFFISALNRRGIAQLRDKIKAHFHSPQKSNTTASSIPLRLAIIGKPNCGKSTLFNCLLHKEKALVSDIAGTTRDPLEELLRFEGKTILLTDTAGLRRRRSIGDAIEKFSLSRTLEVIQKSEVVLLLIDPYEGFDKQNKTILQLVSKETKPLVVAINKLDLLQNDPPRYHYLQQEIKHLQQQFWHFPFFFISAKTGKNCSKPLREAFALKELINNHQVSTAELNRILEKIKQSPIIITQRVKLHYITQALPKNHFIIFGNLNSVTPAIERYILHQLQKTLGIEKLPIALEIRDKVTHKR